MGNNLHSMGCPLCQWAVISIDVNECGRVVPGDLSQTAHALDLASPHVANDHNLCLQRGDGDNWRRCSVAVVITGRS